MGAGMWLGTGAMIGGGGTGGSGEEFWLKQGNSLADALGDWTPAHMFQRSGDILGDIFGGIF
jgi:hypothetical protein